MLPECLDLPLTLSRTANFRLFPSWKNLQMTISTLMKMAESSPNRKKTLWEKEILLIKSNFFFSHNVFKSRLLKISWVKNEEMLVTSIFSNFHIFPQSKENFIFWAEKSKILLSGKGDILKTMKCNFFFHWISTQTLTFRVFFEKMEIAWYPAFFSFSNNVFIDLFWVFKNQDRVVKIEVKKRLILRHCTALTLYYQTTKF